MKQTKTMLIMALAAITGLSQPSSAETTNVFVTSQMQPRAKSFVYGQLSQFVLYGIKPGDRVRIFCGNSMAPIADFQCPSGRIYANNPVKRLEKMGEGFARFKKWVIQKPDRREAYLSLDIPRAFRFAGKNMRRDKAGETFLFLGSPVLRLKAHSDQSMQTAKGKFYPSDGYLASSDAIYGTREGEKGSLSGVKVRMAFLSNPFKGEESWEMQVTRWWHVFAAHRGARLLTAEVSLETVLDQIKSGNDTPFSRSVADVDVPSVMVASKRSVVRIVPTKVIEKATEVKARVYLCDGSSSIRSLRHKIADEIAKRPVEPNVIHQIYAFYDYDRDDKSVPVAHLLAESKDPRQLGAAFRALTFIGGKTNPEAGNEGVICAMETLRKKGLKAHSYELFSDHRPLEASEHPSDRPSFRKLTDDLAKEGIPFTYHWMGKGKVYWTPVPGVKLKRL